MNRAAMMLMDVLYPNRCDCCGERIAYDLLICADCARQLAAMRISYDRWEAPQDVPWEGGTVLYPYADTARTGVLALKDGFRGFGLYAANQLGAEIRRQQETYSCVTWIPVAKRRRRASGFAHAELLGKTIANMLQIPARGDLLTERGSTVRQHDLSEEERRIFANRFQHTGKDLHGQTVLLVDDILTTGNTLRRCTQLLKDAGAAHVRIAAVCASVRAKSDTQNMPHS